MKKFQKNTAAAPGRKKNPFLFILRVLLVILTVIFPVLMVIMAGAGLLYNSDSYGTEISRVGVLLIISGTAMTAGTVLVLLRKNIASLICSCTGFVLCMTMLYKLTSHADSAGWSDAYTMEPASDMYTARILPVIIPFVIAAALALIQFFSYDEREQRRLRKKLREDKENEPAPPII